MKGTFLFILVTKLYMGEISSNKFLLVSVFIHLPDYIRRKQARVCIGQGGRLKGIQDLPNGTLLPLIGLVK